MIKPDARILPTEEEFAAWEAHPVSQFVAAAFMVAAGKQRDAWDSYFSANLIPADLSMKRLELRTREDAYRAFLEMTFERYLELVEGPGGGSKVRPAQASHRRA